MIYELRRYDINPANWDAYRRWCEDLAFPLFHDRFHLPTVGFFEVLPVAEREAAGTRRIGVRWILAWPSVEERRARWAAVANTPEYATMMEHAQGEEGEWLFHIGEEVTLLQAWPESHLQ